MRKAKKTVPYLSVLFVIMIVLIIGYTQLDGERRIRFFSGIAAFAFMGGGIWFLMWIRIAVRREGRSIVTGYHKRIKKKEDNIPVDYQDIVKGVQEAIRSSSYFAKAFCGRVKRLAEGRDITIPESTAEKPVVPGSELLIVLHDIMTRDRRYYEIEEMIKELEDR